jgi:hypothetical protein
VVDEQEVELEGGPHNGGMAQAKLDQGEVAIGSPRGPLYRRTDRKTTDGKPIFAYAPARTALNKFRIDRSRRNPMARRSRRRLSRIRGAITISGACTTPVCRGRELPGLQTGLQLGTHLIPVAFPLMAVTRDNTRFLPAANRHFRCFFALVMRCWQLGP